jgi:hypothetical protein
MRNPHSPNVDSDIRTVESVLYRRALFAEKNEKMLRSILCVVIASLGALAHGENKISLPSTWEEFTLHHRSMENLFGSFKKVFNKSFTNSEEEKQHFNHFVTRVKTIFDWNDPKNAKTRTYTRGINRFTDLSVEERQRFIMPETMADVSPLLSRCLIFYSPLFSVHFIENSLSNFFN